MVDLTACIGPVVEDLSTALSDDMDVRGSSLVVTGENCVKGSNSITIDLRNTSQEGFVKVGRICIVTVAGRHDAAVHSSGVCLPGLQVQASGHVASADINVLVLKVDRHTFLILGNIGAEVFSSDVVRTLGNLWGEDTRRVLVASEQG